MAALHIPTRYALVRRGEKIRDEIDTYFEDAASYGLASEQADPGGELRAIRSALMAMIDREREILVRVRDGGG